MAYARMTWLAPFNSGHEEYFRGGTNGLNERILIYLAVNRDGRALQHVSQLGPARPNLHDQIPIRARSGFKFPLATRYSDEAVRKNNFSHTLRARRPNYSSNAASTFGGDSGRSQIRLPAARDAALDAAASGATIGVSPTPRTP